MLETLIVNRRHQDGVVILELKGELTMQTTDRFVRQVEDMISPLDVIRIVFDVKGLNYIDSSGLGQFVHLQRKAKESGGVLVLARVGAHLMELIFATKLDRVIDYALTIDDAVAIANSVSRNADNLQVVGENLSSNSQTDIDGLDQQLEDGHFLPRHEGFCNYPTWYVSQWILQNPDYYDKTIEIINTSIDQKTASSALFRMTVELCDPVRRENQLASALIGFGLNLIQWHEVIDFIRRNPAVH